MKKICDIKKMLSKVKLICWDLDGTLFDTEVMWYNMDKLIVQKYGNELNKEEVAKASEKIAANAYKNFEYRANAEKTLNYFKEKKYIQVVINKCDLTNKTMFNNEKVNNTFSFNNFDYIVSEKNFEKKFTDEDMYIKALELTNILNKKEVVAICDMPFELRAAKNCGITTIWAKNKEYPFTEVELKEIEEIADYYVEDFGDLI